MTTKKIHPADAADHALIPACKKFTATILKDNKPQTTEHPTLEAARIEAAKLNATSNNGRKALVYAITDDGRAILVPASYGTAKVQPMGKQASILPEIVKPKTSAPTEADIAAAKEEAAERAELKAAKPAAKADKPAKKAKAAKQAKAKPAKKAKPEGKSKVEIVIKMLTGGTVYTRKEIAEATEWPSINIKAICERKGMKLTQAKDGTLSASAPKA